jgi:hypothetical protein
MEIAILTFLVIISLTLIYPLYNRNRQSLVKQTFLVNLKDGSAIKGLLMSDGDRLCLAEAFYITDKETRIDGLVYIDRVDISFLTKVN